MSSSDPSKLLKTQGYFSTDLVTLDFKSDSLQKFLQHVVSIVNQHSYKINQLEFDKLDRIEVLSGHQVLTNAISFSHPVLTKTIVPKKQLLSGDDDGYAERNERLANKLDCYNQAIEYLCRVGEEREGRVSVVERRQGEMVTVEGMKERLRVVEGEGRKFAEDECARVQGRMKELEGRMNKKIGDFQNLVANVEKKTLWKITQCEEGLGKKVTAEYVDRALEQYEAKIIREIKNNMSTETNDLKFKLEDFIKTYHRDQQKQTDLFQNSQKLIKELQELTKTFHNQQQATAQHRELESRLKQTSYRVEKLEKQVDPKQIELKLTRDISEVFEKTGDLMKRLKGVEEQLESVGDVMGSMGGVDGGGDPHRLCYLDGEIKRVKDVTRGHEGKLVTLEEELRTKLLVFEERIGASLAMMRNQENNVSRQELYECVNRVREPMNERFADNQNVLNEILGKVQKLQSTEKAIRKKIKEMTKGDDLSKILDQKQNISEAKIINSGMVERLESFEVYLQKMRMDLDYNNSWIKEMQEKMGGVQEGFSIISNKQRIFPAKCLTCGIKHVPQHSRNEMQGSDGKFYRVDLRGGCVFDQEEVFDVVPSQISLVQAAKQSRVQSAKGRGQQQQQHHQQQEFQSTAGNTGGFYSGFRPHSAKKF